MIIKKKRSPVIVILKSVTTPTIVTTVTILMNQNSTNKFWDRSSKDNFSKKSTYLIRAKNISQTPPPPPPHTHTHTQAMFLDESESLRKTFEKGYPGNISVKLF